MVIDGRQIPKNNFAFVRFEGERICFPPRFADKAGLAGKEELEHLLLVLTAGRFRLLSPPLGNVPNDLSRILNKWESVGREGDVLAYTDSNSHAGIRGRLISCTISPPPPGWRLNVPKEAKELGPADRAGMFVLIVAGFVELWFPETLRQATSVPFSEILD